MYSAVFALYGVMEVLGLMPQELISAGLTLPGLFAGYYGDPVSGSCKAQRVNSHNYMYN